MGQGLSLAINGRERQLCDKLVPFTDAESGGVARESVAIIGLGYVGLPTACALRSVTVPLTGIDISEDRLCAIKRGEVDLVERDKQVLAAGLADGSIRITSDSAALSDADAVIVCVPTPVDERFAPDLGALRAACDSVVEHARPGQTILLTSTTFVGTTRQLLVEPLERRGLRAGTDVFVAFSPERIDPGNPDHEHRETPRVVGGVTPECARRGARVVARMTDSVYLVSSPEAAELTKLYENIFRAVNLSLANEFADVCGSLGLDPVEVTLAAGTKPYGFLGSFPGPGVGGHCIPCDPHYLLWQLRESDTSAPLIEQAMRLIQVRPHRVVRRVVDMLTEADVDVDRARVLLVGVTYKAGVRDLRSSPALPILSGLAELGITPHYHDPLMPEIVREDGVVLASEDDCQGQDWDLAVVHTVHPGLDYGWVHDCPRVLDATYQFDTKTSRQIV